MPPELDEVFDQTRGLWADWDGIEEILQDSRDKWDQAWQARLAELEAAFHDMPG